MISGRYAIRVIDPLSALKYGFVLGALLMFLPGLLAGVVLRSLVVDLVEAMSGGFFMPDLGPLGDLYEMGWGLVLRSVFYAVIAGSILGALSSLLAALLYDVVAATTGGLIVHADLLEQKPAGYLPGAPAQAAAFSTPAPLPAPAAHPVNPPATSAASSALAWLVATDGSGQRWPVRAPITTVGGSFGCDIALPGLVDQHAEIRLENNRYILYDHSGGQTWVNGRQVATANMLKDGFVVKLAGREFLFRSS